MEPVKRDDGIGGQKVEQIGLALLGAIVGGGGRSTWTLITVVSTVSLMRVVRLRTVMDVGGWVPVAS